MILPGRVVASPINGCDALLRRLLARSVINARRVNIQHLLVETPFRGADVPDALEQFIEIILLPLAGRIFQPLVVHRESLDDIFAQPLRGPLAELRAPVRFHPVTDRNDDVEIVICRLVGFPIGGSLCIICTYCFLHQFSFLENIADVLGDDRALPLEQFRQLCLREPDGFIFQPDFNPRPVVLGLVKNQF